MKTKATLLFPWLFSILAGLVYFLAFKTLWKPEDYTTLMLVLCTAIGWSSIIFIKRGDGHKWLKIYVIVSIVFPLIYIEILKFTSVDPLWHRITFGLMILAMIFLNYFISMIKRK